MPIGGSHHDSDGFTVPPIVKMTKDLKRRAVPYQQRTCRIQVRRSKSHIFLKKFLLYRNGLNHSLLLIIPSWLCLGSLLEQAIGWCTFISDHGWSHQVPTIAYKADLSWHQPNFSNLQNLTTCRTAKLCRLSWYRIYRGSTSRETSICPALAWPKETALSLKKNVWMINRIAIPTPFTPSVGAITAHIPPTKTPPPFQIRGSSQ